MAKLLVRAVIGLVFATGLLAITGPLTLYWLGLSAVDSLPEPPAAIASMEQQAVVWVRERGQGAPSVNRLSPHSYLLAWGTATPPDPGELVAWRVASDHLLAHRRSTGMFWWHLSGAALTIWITRNWSTEQIMSQASLLRSRDAGSEETPFK